VERSREPRKPLTPSALKEWCRIPPDELSEASPVPLTVLPSAGDVHRRAADDMFSEIRGARESGSELCLIVPLGPTGQYPLLAGMINDAALPLEHVTFVGMDQWLDWEARPIAWDHPLNLEGAFHRLFLNRLDPVLRPPPANVIFPSVFELDRPSEELQRRGGAATTYGGFGYQGHLAFNEPPSTRWSAVTLDQLRASRTRVVPLAVDTIVAHSQRSRGGNPWAVPPMAVTLGMADLLAARRLRLYTDGGSWKQTILRIMLFAEPTVEYPATLIADHPDVEVVVDAASAAPPPTDW
jgi:glucosamine-6-phosphate deaminase